MAGSPLDTTQALAVVPPMSNAMRSDRPRRSPSHAAPVTPAAGPDSVVRTGCTTAASTLMMPPFDWVLIRGAEQPRSARPSFMAVMYVLTAGPIYAFTTAVDVRSYSRSSRDTSVDTVTYAPPSASRTMVATLRSWLGFAYE